MFVSGFAVAIQEALRSALQPPQVTGFVVGYVVLAITLVLESVAFGYSFREVRRRARARDRSIMGYLRSTTEPATTTEFIGNGIGLGGGVLATAALALTQATGSRWPDAIASGLIGLALIVAAVALTQQNRSLLTGRSIQPALVERMRELVIEQVGVVDVPDLFALVVGPRQVIVDGDVTLEDNLSVPEAEAVFDRAATALRSHWPEVTYVYLNPVGERRRRGTK